MRKLYRLTRISVLPAAKVTAVLYLILGVFVAAIALAAGLFIPSQAQWFSFVLAICAPFVCGVFGFVYGALGSALYNAVAGWLGGIEFEQEERPGP